MPEYQTVDLGFSTADGEDISFQFKRGDIEFTFVDWREQVVRFTASDVRAFSWLEECDVPELRDDTTYEVKHSTIVSSYRKWNLIVPHEEYKHYKLCFNAAGVFDVVCASITISSQNS